MNTLRFKTRFILHSVLIFLATMIIVTVIAVHGVWYIAVNNQKDELLETATNLNLYIQEKTALLGSDEERAAYLFSNASDIYNVVINYSTCQIELFNYDGILLAYNANNEEPTYMNSEYQTCLTRQEPVMSIRQYNGQKELWVMAPIQTKTYSVIGFVGLVSPLRIASSLMFSILLLMLGGTLVGLLFAIFVLSRYSDSFTNPVKTLTQIISSEINLGQYDKTIQYRKNDEIGDLTMVYNDMIENTKRVITQLQSERRRLGNVLATLDDGLLALDTNGDVITYNKYIKTYFDVSDPKSIYDFNFFTFLIDLFDSLKNGKSSVSEEVEVKGRILLITGSPIKGEKLEENYLFIVRNVTTARTLEKEQRKFISSISHELRTPLTTIIGFSDYLNRRHITDPDELSTTLDKIYKEGKRLVRLVDDLVNANSVESMVFSVYLEPVDLNELLEGVVEQMRIKSLEKQIEIIYKAEKNLPQISGDFDRLMQIFINIIHNAIKFSSPGGIIDVVLTKEEEYLSVSIRDYGIGIDPAKKDFIFSAFYRVDEARSRSEGEGGAGLGLYLVKQVVDKHNGKIFVDSELEEGTNITVKLPLPEEEIEEDYFEFKDVILGEFEDSHKDDTAEPLELNSTDQSLKKDETSEEHSSDIDIDSEDAEAADEEN